MKEHDSCYFCGGTLEDRVVEVIRKRKNKIVIIENVPAGVCIQCGERYYPGKVAEDMERLIQSEAKGIRTISVPVMEYRTSQA